MLILCADCVFLLMLWHSSILCLSLENLAFIFYYFAAALHLANVANVVCTCRFIAPVWRYVGNVVWILAEMLLGNFWEHQLTSNHAPSCRSGLSWCCFYHFIFSMSDDEHRIVLGFKIKSNMIKENVALIDASIMCFSKTISEFSGKIQLYVWNIWNEGERSKMSLPASVFSISFSYMIFLPLQESSHTAWSVVCFIHLLSAGNITWGRPSRVFRWCKKIVGFLVFALVSFEPGRHPAGATADVSARRGNTGSVVIVKRQTDGWPFWPLLTLMAAYRHMTEHVPLHRRDLTTNDGWFYYWMF